MSDAINTITNCSCSTIKVRAGVVDARSKSESVLFARTSRQDKSIVINAFWFAKGTGHRERRVCEHCIGDAWHVARIR